MLPGDGRTAIGPSPGSFSEVPAPPPATRPTPDEALPSLALVLNEVRLGHSRSRAELVERTGLGRATVSRRVSELLERGLLMAGDVGPSTGGRPPLQLRFHGDAGHLLVADLGATSIDVALTTIDGRILGHRDEPARIEAGPEAVLGRVDELFASLLTSTPSIAGSLWGIGIGVPGPVEFGSGRPVSPPIMPGWDGYGIRARFVRRYRAPVWVDNDVNVLALGEWRNGVAAGHPNVVIIKIGTGIGAGVISDGRLHRGAQGGAGDVGHIQVTDDATVVCRCGNIGCLEALAGGAALARAGEAAARDGSSAHLRAALERRDAVTAEDVARAAAVGDPVALALFEVAGQRIGGMLAGIVNFFNPSLVVVGGGVANGPEQLLSAIRDTVVRRSLPLATRDLQIRRSSLGGLAGVIGCASMVVDQLFSPELLAHWIDGRQPAANLSSAGRAG